MTAAVALETPKIPLMKLRQPKASAATRLDRAVTACAGAKLKKCKAVNDAELPRKPVMNLVKPVISVTDDYCAPEDDCMEDDMELIPQDTKRAACSYSARLYQSLGSLKNSCSADEQFNLPLLRSLIKQLPDDISRSSDQLLKCERTDTGNSQTQRKVARVQKTLMEALF
eukprot:TRINITY_DN3215_c0_g5_i2.p1 TRINITY_DN3215_c0_g5~~TRINITY_DN3215_c0_g5_i2.p1  ORF type:complete len:170 (+),score=12.17 TRINITY_DN3215_c0_g5_i2:106-615(+)